MSNKVWQDHQDKPWAKVRKDAPISGGIAGPSTVKGFKGVQGGRMPSRGSVTAETNAGQVIEAFQAAKAAQLLAWVQIAVMSVELRVTLVEPPVTWVEPPVTLVEPPVMWVELRAMWVELRVTLVEFPAEAVKSVTANSGGDELITLIQKHRIWPTITNYCQGTKEERECSRKHFI